MKHEKDSIQRDTLAVRFSFIQPNISGLEGKILTIVDASLEGEKRDAVKDLVKEAFRRNLDWFEEVTHTDLNGDYGTHGRPYPEQTVKVD